MTMSRYLLHHRHAAGECGVAWKSFKGHSSPLRHGTTVASCAAGGHDIWWIVAAGSADDALALLPFYIATRAIAVEVREVRIP
jgi:hypothetical protein